MSLSNVIETFSLNVHQPTHTVVKQNCNVGTVIITYTTVIAFTNILKLHFVKVLLYLKYIMS